MPRGWDDPDGVTVFIDKIEHDRYVESGLATNFVGDEE